MCACVRACVRVCVCALLYILDVFIGTQDCRVDTHDIKLIVGEGGGRIRVKNKAVAMSSSASCVKSVYADTD